MRRSRALSLIVASGWTPFEPTEEQRKLVTLLEFNGTPHARIAEGLRIKVEELHYYFADELGYSRDRILAQAADRILQLSRQTSDLSVSLRATELMLRTRLSSWREPDPRGLSSDSRANIPKLSLAEVERELHGLGPSGATEAGAEPTAAAGKSG